MTNSTLILGTNGKSVYSVEREGNEYYALATHDGEYLYSSKRYKTELAAIQFLAKRNVI